MPKRSLQLKYLWNWQQATMWSVLCCALFQRVDVAICAGTAAFLSSPIYHSGWRLIFGQQAPYRLTLRLATYSMALLAVILIAASLTFAFQLGEAFQPIGEALAGVFRASSEFFAVLNARSDPRTASAVGYIAVIQIIWFAWAFLISVFVIAPSFDSVQRDEQVDRLSSAAVPAWLLFLGMTASLALTPHFSASLIANGKIDSLDLARSPVAVLGWMTFTAAGLIVNAACIHVATITILKKDRNQ